MATISLCYRLIAFTLVAALAPLSVRVSAASNLSPYFVYLLPGNVGVTSPEYEPKATFTANPPIVRFYGDTVTVFGVGIFYVAGLIQMRYETVAPHRLTLPYLWRGDRQPAACRTYGTYLAIPNDVEPNTKIIDNATWFYPTAAACAQEPSYQSISERLNVIDEVTFTEPKRRTALDRSQYDASAMVMVRNGVPWMTYHWGYRLGLVASKSDWNAANSLNPPELLNWPAVPSSKDEFELTALPPPRVEDDVVEYVNKTDFPKQPGGQFFYAVLAADKTLLDSVPNWQRTGKAFKSGGYVSVCRFYGGKNGGPNTHFYSADDKECAALKAVPQLSYEGQTFAVNMPMPGSNADGTKPCPIDSKPLYRLYNNASAPGKDYVSNHRYVAERTDIAAAVAQGWVDEGQVMCVPM